MSEYIKIQAQTTQELLEHLDVSDDDAKPFIQQEQHPVVVVKNLFENKFFIEGIKLLAHALPKRESVWWACLAVRQSLVADESEEGYALQSAELWARQPTEENRQQCKQWAEKLEYKTAASWAATAATWCTGSIADPDQPEVAPPEQLYAHAVAGAVSLAAVVNEPSRSEEYYTHFLQQGLNLAAGGNGQV